LPSNCIKLPIYSNCKKLFTSSSSSASSSKPSQITSNSNNGNATNTNKLAPKAIIADDGDIDIAEAKSSPSSGTTNQRAKSNHESIYSMITPHKQEQQLNMLLLNKQNIYSTNTPHFNNEHQYRHSMRLPSNSNATNSFSRAFNERHSQRIVSSTKPHTNNSTPSNYENHVFISNNNYNNCKQLNYCNSNGIIQQQQQQQQSKQSLSQNQQNQLAAAAAAAAAVSQHFYYYSIILLCVK